MAVKKDWLPATRDAILTMVKMWLILIAANLQKWGIIESVSQTLAALAANAESALDTAKNESTHTPVATAQCKEAFDALIAEMRDVKRRYFFLPPLTNADLQALRLNPNDAWAYYNRGLAYFEKGDYARAIADWEKALQLNPNIPYVRDMLEIPRGG